MVQKCKLLEENIEESFMTLFLEAIQDTQIQEKETKKDSGTTSN